MTDIDRTGPWRTASRSNTGGGQCVQTRAAMAGQHPVRVHLGDSKITKTPVLDLNPSDYQAFLTFVRG